MLSLLCFMNWVFSNLHELLNTFSSKSNSSKKTQTTSIFVSAKYACTNMSFDSTAFSVAEESVSTSFPLRIASIIMLWIFKTINSFSDSIYMFHFFSSLLRLANFSNPKMMLAPIMTKGSHLKYVLIQLVAVHGQTIWRAPIIHQINVAIVSCL